MFNCDKKSLQLTTTVCYILYETMNWEKIVSYNFDQRNEEISRVERSLRLKMAERSETSLRALSFATPRSAIVHKMEKDSSK